MKMCNKCNKIKPLSEFYSCTKVNKQGKEYTYYRPDCKECTKQSSKTWIKNNPDKFRDIILKNHKTQEWKEIRKECNKNYRKNGQYSKWQHSHSNQIQQYQENRQQHKKHTINKKEWESCKEYFSNQCAYCGLPIEKHFIAYRGQTKQGDFHKEHVIHNGKNDLSNCVPSCKECNSSKWTYNMEEWYKQQNFFSEERLNKIIKWLELNKWVISCKLIK